MRKGLQRQIIRDLARLLADVHPDWLLIDQAIARRAGAWVQDIGVFDSRRADEFVPSHGLNYLRAWDSTVRIEGILAATRLKTDNHRVDDWIAERRFRSDPTAVIEQLREQVRPRIDEPLRPEVAERVLRERVQDWNVHHALVFIAAERLDRREALSHLADLERMTVDRPLGDWVDSAREVVGLIDRPDVLRAHLDAIEDAKLGSLKGRPLG